MAGIEEHRAKLQAFLTTQTVENFGSGKQDLVIAPENITPVEGFELLAGKQAWPHIPFWGKVESNL